MSVTCGCAPFADCSLSSFFTSIRYSAALLLPLLMLLLLLISSHGVAALICAKSACSYRRLLPLLLLLPLFVVSNHHHQHHHRQQQQRRHSGSDSDASNEASRATGDNMCVIAAAAHRHIYSLSAFSPPSLCLSFSLPLLLLLLCDFGRNYCEIAHHVARLSPALIGGSFYRYTFPARAHIVISVCVCAQCA